MSIVTQWPSILTGLLAQNLIQWILYLGLEGTSSLLIIWINNKLFAHRRNGPGMYFADEVIYISCSICLAVFNVSKYVDPASGGVVTPEYYPLPGIVSLDQTFSLIFPWIITDNEISWFAVIQRLLNALSNRGTERLLQSCRLKNSMSEGPFMYLKNV